MRITPVNNNANYKNNQTFGTAFITFNKLRVQKLPKENSAEVQQIINALTEELNFFMMHQTDLLFSDDSTPDKWMAISGATNSVGIRIKSTPEEELNLVEKFKKLFENKGITTEIIPDTPENEWKINATSSNQLLMVEMLGQ